MEILSYDNNRQMSKASLIRSQQNNIAFYIYAVSEIILTSFFFIFIDEDHENCIMTFKCLIKELM